LVAPFMPYLGEALYQNLVVGQRAGAPVSVHVADWPQVDEALVDEDLLRATALLLETVGLGRSARKQANLRIRQPLRELLVSAPGGAEALHRFEDDLRDELNVKDVRFLEVGAGLVVQRFKPNLPVVGKKYGRLVPAIRQALEGLAGPKATAAAEAAKAGEAFDLQVGEQTLALGPDDVLIEASSPPGYAVAESGGLLVALNTTLTPELVLEGQARDLVRFIQDARKAADLAIADRIDVVLQPPADLDLQPLLEAHGDYVRAETLATSLAIGDPAPGAHVAEAELGRHTVHFALCRSNVPAPVPA
jgi:isoleucyl-tRNA synthetase